MCRLFGLVANKDVNVEFSFYKADRSIRDWSQENPHGWGIGWYEGDQAKVYKEGQEQTAGYDFGRARWVRSRVVVAHVRKATTGDHSRRNAHPFLFRNWLFIHNGCVDREFILSQLQGEYGDALTSDTDSEVYFRLVRQWVQEAGDPVRGIKEAVSVVKEARHTGLNFIMTDGTTLYAYRDAGQYRDHYSLFYLRRDPAEHVKVPAYLSEETQLLIESKALMDEKAVLVASEEMTGENWQKVELGQLLIVDRNLQVSKHDFGG